MVTHRIRHAPNQNEPYGDDTMKTWSKPEFQNLRYGFEINLYVKVR